MSNSTRARDIDRAQTAAVLDAVQDDGQLDSDDHASRVAAALQAKTIGELDALTADLQIPDYVLAAQAPLPATVPWWRRGRVLAGAGAVVVIAVVLAVTLSGGDDAPAPAAPAPSQQVPGEPEPIVLAPIDTFTADGLDTFLRLLQKRFGDQVVDEAILRGDSAWIERAVPGQPHRSQDWSFQGGFESFSSTGSRDLDEPTVDLAQLNVDALVRLLAAAPDLVHQPSGHPDRVMISTNNSSGTTMTIYVTDNDGRSGYVMATLAGDVVFLLPADR